MSNWLRSRVLQVSAALAVSIATAQGARAQSLHDLVEAYFEEYLQLDPIEATFIGDPRYNDKLPNDIAPEAVAARLATEQRYLDAAMRFDIDTLSPSDRITWDVFVEQRRMAIAGAQFPAHLLPVDQLLSLPLIIPMLASGTSAQPFANAQDYDNFLERLRAYVTWSDQAITNMRAGAERGIVQPRVVMEKLLAQLGELIVEDPKASLFYAAVRQVPKEVAPKDAERIAVEYEKAAREDVLPAYRRLRDFMRDEYLPKTRTSVSWAALPQGDGWYSYLVELETTSKLTPAAIHDMGLKEVARIRREMEGVRRRAKFKGDLKAFVQYLQNDPRFYFQRPEDLIETYRDLKRRIDARLPRLFSDFPKADYEVRAVEEFRAASAAGASYQQPSADGSRPGIFYINTFNLKAQPKWGTETLSLHEAAPGHHFQIAIQQELGDLPSFRRFGGYTAFMEGWALYAESLGKELGLFKDPYQYFGRLNDEMLRAMRLVVDTGIHAQGWTRERAIDYMLENSALARSDVESEVERYIARPGQALAYKIGQFKISELRSRAQQALGRQFDIKEFHSQVLRDGALPLDVLDAKIERWIAAKKASSTTTNKTAS
ncbi:MAG: DUF885 domain-containing protein [Steroidobacteraceae bacterium]